MRDFTVLPSKGYTLFSHLEEQLSNKYAPSRIWRHMCLHDTVLKYMCVCVRGGGGHYESTAASQAMEEHVMR